MQFDETLETNSFSNSDSNDDSDDNFVKHLPNRLRQQPINAESQAKILTNFAVACDRTDVSSKAAAMIATAALHDISGRGGIIIDKNKVSKERQKARLQNVNSVEYENVATIYFDGKKDWKMVMEESGAKKARKEIIKEHITVLSEPGGKYLGQFVSSSGTAEDIANGLLAFCVDKRIGVFKINSLGCDRTNTNMGWKSGVIKRLEEKLGRYFHWIIRQLDCNELPLWHLLIRLEGKTCGPCQYTGPIG